MFFSRLNWGHEGGTWEGVHSYHIIHVICKLSCMSYPTCHIHLIMHTTPYMSYPPYHTCHIHPVMHSRPRFDCHCVIGCSFAFLRLCWLWPLGSLPVCSRRLALENVSASFCSHSGHAFPAWTWEDYTSFHVGFSTVFNTDAKFSDLSHAVLQAGIRPSLPFVSGQSHASSAPSGSSHFQ